jgi:hypothetical protein
MLLLDQPSTVPSDPGALIEEARRRTRKRRARIAAVLLALSVGAAVAADIGGGGSGRGAGGHAGGQSSGAGGGSAAGSASRLFPGAPATQPNGYGVADHVCPLAPANRYLPARSGCVTVAHTDVNGGGRPALILVYSRLSRQHPNWFGPDTSPASLNRDFVAEASFLKIVLANGTTVMTRIPHAWAASVDSIAHVTSNPGSEIFLEVGRISSGAWALAYGYHDGRLVPAGATLYYGGDSASKAGFSCLPGNPPRLIQRTYELLGPTIYAWWRETQITYTWHGSRLVQSAKQTFKRYGPLSKSDTSIGHGCTAAGIS